MPRIPPRLIRQASSIDPLLAQLLPVTRDLQSAKNELRWLREHAVKQSLRQSQQQNSRDTIDHSGNSGDVLDRLRKYCYDRGRGKPLQYILGTEYFGDLEIKCQPGVLIPRWETASLVEHLAKVLHERFSKDRSRPLRVLDPCTGTGCMSLLLQHSLKQLRYPSPVHTLGLDMSPQAISLAQRNLAHLGLGNISGAGSSVDLRLADVLVTSTHAGTSEGVSGWQTVLEQHDLKYRQSWRTSTNISGPKDKGKTALSLQWDVLMSNPPYVSPRQYQKVTSRSVRHYEPQIALVPPSSHGQVETDDARADVFYHALIDMAIETGVRYILFEVGDAAQAARVVKVMQEKLGEAWKSMRVEVWRDEPGVPAGDGPMAIDEELLNGVAVTGRGNVRGVFAFEIV